MSFTLTTDQILERRKWVTRRAGWTKLNPGTLLRAVKQAMGLRKGQKVQELAILRVVDVRMERLDEIVRPGPYGAQEMILEGFPGMDPQQFLNLASFEDHDPSVVVNRIQFEYVRLVPRHGASGALVGDEIFPEFGWKLDEELRPYRRGFDS